MRTIFVAIAAGLCSGLAIAQTAPLDIKGLYPGQPIGAAEKIAPGLGLACGWFGTLGPTLECHYSPRSRYSKEPSVPALDTIAGRAALLWLLTARDGALTSVSATFRTQDFDLIAAALREKYGAETKRADSTIQNRAGATFDQVQIEWRAADRTLVITKRGGKVDTGRIKLVSDQELLDSKRDQEKGAKDAAKDL
jgi:hypothetical protein